MKIYTFLFISLYGLLLTSCKTESSTSHTPIPTNNTIEMPGFIHTVYFWFKEDSDPKLKEEFVNGLEELAKVKSIQSVYYGPPAGTPRDVVDNSYDYAWVTHFKTSADHDAYQIDPIHLEFIEKYKSLWKEVVVYDNLVQ